MTSAPTQQRICFTLQVKPERLDEYRRRHEDVWPQMQQALRDAGWTNYSLFLREDGLLVGYLETPDWDAARRQMALTEVNAQWQASVADLFVDLGKRHADDAMAPLPEVFHLS
ncbi:MAG TPA: L-rhamnose mutarotase [Actinomycetales bacterium]|nr:L-rhamnose mutarotase [Actinomycetales bacterium]